MSTLNSAISSRDFCPLFFACVSLSLLPGRLRLVESERLDDEACSHLASGCHLLTSIDLSWCEGVSASGLVPLVRACPSLAECELRCCSKASARHLLRVLCTNCVDLRVLNLNRCDDEYGETDGSDPSTSSYGTTADRSTRDPPPLFAALGFEVATEPCRFFARLPLRTSRLEWLDVGWLAELIDDSVLALLLTSLKCLSVLSVEGCKQLSARALAPLLPREVPTASAPVGAAVGAAMGAAAAKAVGAAEVTTATGTGAETGADVACGEALLRLNCSWVDDIPTSALYAVIRAHAERRRHALARRIESRLEAALNRGDLHSEGPHELSSLLLPRPARLLCLDYYGTCYGMGADGKPVQCALEPVPLPHLEKPLTGWVAAYHGGAESYYEVS